MATTIRSTRDRFWLSVSRKPRPRVAAMSSATTTNSHACDSPRRRPVSKLGMLAGSMIRRAMAHQDSWYTRPTSTSLRSTPAHARRRG